MGGGEGKESLRVHFVMLFYQQHCDEIWIHLFPKQTNFSTKYYVKGEVRQESLIFPYSIMPSTHFPKHNKILCFSVNKSLVPCYGVHRAGITIEVSSFYISLKISSLLRDSTAVPTGKEPPLAFRLKDCVTAGN